MYSRSYGLIEQTDKAASAFSVPLDYNGNLYRNAEKKDSEHREIPQKIADPPPPDFTKTVSPPEEKKPPVSSGITGGFLERLTAEDILLFIFLYSLLKGESDDGGEILGLILALLLL